MSRQTAGLSPKRTALPPDRVMPVKHSYCAASSTSRETGTESDTSDNSDDEEEEESGEDKTSVWGRPVQLLCPVGAAFRRLIELRQLPPQLELLHSFVGGGGLDDDSDEERLERAKRTVPAGGRRDTAVAAATPYWPPSSWAALERQSPAPPPPKTRRGVGGCRASPGRRGAQTLFVDQCRAAAFSNVRDIKITLQRHTVRGDWLSTERTGWSTLASEAETALRRRRYRYATDLFSKALVKMPPEQGEIRLRLGRAESLIRLKRFTQAGDDARWVRQRKPDNATAQLLEADALFESGEPELALLRYHCGRHSAPGRARFTAGIRRCEDVIKRLLSPGVLKKIKSHASCLEPC